MALRLLASAGFNMFVVADDGVLRYYQYEGHGEPNPVPGNYNWADVSGVPIGHGWEDVTWILPYFGSTEIVILAVRDNGDVHWYGWNPDPIVSDWSGTNGWSANSGNIVGHGFDGLEHVVSWGTTFDGGSGLLCVDPDGAMRWYYYEGHGEWDPTGAQGWRPNSGNVIGHKWTGLQRLVGSTDTLFGVTPDGNLHWYRYTGSGVADPTGTQGWDTNSGNSIGNGWNSLTGLTSYTFDQEHHYLFGIEPSGQLRWYEYHGLGEDDPAASIGWHPNSGNVISAGW
jgi:hypothetical protein